MAEEGARVVLAARDTGKLGDLASETGARAVACDASVPEQVEALFADVDATEGAPRLVVFNPSRRVPGPFVDIDPEAVADAIMVSAYGGFLVGQAGGAAHALGVAGGTILFTGASASVKGYPRSAAFAMGKFALRGLVQSMARELAPQNIHVAHFVIDGGIRKLGVDDDVGEAKLDPNAIARTYLERAPAGSQRVDLGEWSSDPGWRTF